jgi:hypothetical protein
MLMKNESNVTARIHEKCENSTSRRVAPQPYAPCQLDHDVADRARIGGSGGNINQRDRVVIGIVELWGCAEERDIAAPLRCECFLPHRSRAAGYSATDDRACPTHRFHRNLFNLVVGGLDASIRIRAAADSRAEMHPRARLFRERRPIREVFSRPRCPSWCPLFAVKRTVRRGEAATIARIVSSQQAIPAPRSAAQAHHPLRGVITTSGAREGSLPATVATTLEAWAAVRVAYATTRVSASRSASAASDAQSRLLTCCTGGPNGCMNAGALIGQSPGRVEAVTRTSARRGALRRIATSDCPSFPMVLMSATTRPISLCPGE